MDNDKIERIISLQNKANEQIYFCGQTSDDVMDELLVLCDSLTDEESDELLRRSPLTIEDIMCHEIETMSELRYLMN